MLKLFIIAIATVLLTGCGVFNKTVTVLTCIDGKVYVDVYKGELVSQTENIVHKDYLRISKSLYTNDKGEWIKCTE